jgi:ribosomal protein S30
MNETHRTTSELMLEYCRRVEKAKGSRLTPDEVRRVTPEALTYAKMVRNWIPKKPKKGTESGHKNQNSK